ncbi:MAG: hypothetical protein JWN87_873 [Frankiales bacterium]|nr:hypothetical protein [Frankiales bacterium]
MTPPPPLALLAYRFVGWRLGPDHAHWVRDDVARRGWLVRQGVPVLAAVLAVGGGLTAAVGGDQGRIVQVVAIVAAISLFFRSSLRERALRQQGIDAAGTPLAEATWYADDAARRRRNLLATTSTVVMVVGGLAFLAVRSRT